VKFGICYQHFAAIKRHREGEQERERERERERQRQRQREREEERARARAEDWRKAERKNHHWTIIAFMGVRVANRDIR